MISERYTLFSRIPVYLDGDRVLTDHLWSRDLEKHLDYVRDFVLCCPVQPISKTPESATEVNGLTADKVKALSAVGGWVSVALTMLPNFWRVAKAVRDTEIVHSGGAGWPFPLSFYILFLHPFLRFQWIIVVESSFWMKPANRIPTPRQWIRHYLTFFLLRASLRRADARIFTSDSYRQLFRISNDASLIAPAIWVDEENVISEEDLDAQLAALPKDEVRLIFPARLVADKGPDMVFEAVEAAEALLSPNSPRLAIDFVGDGPLAESCRAFAERHKGKITVRHLQPVAYGEPFFELLRSYHAILLANRQQEPVRVIFDGFSQGLPTISTATRGVSELVTDGENALLYKIDDVDGLARILAEFAADSELRTRLAKNARAAAVGRSHAGMHRTREAFLRANLNSPVGHSRRFFRRSSKR